MTTDLRDMAWIPVLRVDGGHEDVGLRDVFRRSDEFIDIAPELTVQRDAILRLCLAIMWRAVPVTDSEDWSELRESGNWREDVLSYLDSVDGRWDLFDQTAPFFQTPSLQTAKAGYSGLEKLVLDVPVGEQMFIGRRRSSYTSLSAEEAARNLLALMAFDPSGIKSGAVGDASVKGGKGYPMGTAATGRFHLVVALGSTLAETLLLNLMPRGTGSLAELDVEDDLPAWERPVPSALREDRLPDGPVDLMTWQSRRIRLIHEDQSVVGVIVANGDRFAEQNAHALEPFSIWRYSEPQTRKTGATTFMPAMVDPAVHVWRGLSRWLGRVVPGRKEEPVPPRPAIVEWIGQLSMSGAVQPRTVRFRTSGVQYGRQSAVVQDLVDDSLALPAIVLREDTPVISGLVGEAVQASERAVRAVGYLAANLARAAGDRDDLARKAGESAARTAREQAYAALDAPIRTWLVTLAETPVDRARAVWFREASRIIGRLGDELVASAPPSAWSLREGTEIDAPRADHSFRRALRDIFPAADDITTPHEEATHAER